MLHKVIDKTLKQASQIKKSPNNAAPRYSMLTSAILSSRDIFGDVEAQNENQKMVSPFESLDKIDSPQKKSTIIYKRYSTFMQKYSNDNKFFSSDILEKKTKRIKELEDKLKCISETLYELALKIRESLQLEDIFDEEIKNFLLTDDILLKLKDNDPKFSVELIKILVEKSLDLKMKVKKICTTTENFINIKENEKDYMLLFQQLDLKLRESKKNEENMKFLLDIAKMRSADLERQNKLILQKTNDVLSEWKSDYLKLIDVLKEKDKNLENCQQELEEKKTKIFNLQDRLISINILETKIQALEKNYDKEKEKMIKKYDQIVKEASDPYKIAPNLILFKSEKEDEILLKEKKTKDIQRSLLSLLNDRQQKEKELQNKIKKLELDSSRKSLEISKAKEKLADANKEILTSRTQSSSKKKTEFFTKRTKSFSSTNIQNTNLSKKSQNNKNQIFLTNYT